VWGFFVERDCAARVLGSFPLRERKAKEKKKKGKKGDTKKR